MIVKSASYFDDNLLLRTADLDSPSPRAYTFCHFTEGTNLAFSAGSDGNPIILVLFLAVAFAAGIRVFGWNYVKSILAAGWSMTQGHVEFGSVEERRVRYVTYYIARIDYSYSVNNQYYSGYFEKVFLRESSADKFVATMKGQQIFVRSNPHRPDRSALLKQDQPGGWA